MILVELVEPCGVRVITRDEISKDETVAEHWFTVAQVRELQLAVRRCQNIQLEVQETKQTQALESLPGITQAAQAASVIETQGDTPTAEQLSDIAQMLQAANTVEIERKLFDLTNDAIDSIQTICAVFWAKLLDTEADNVPANLGFESLVLLEEHVTASPFHSLTTEQTKT